MAVEIEFNLQRPKLLAPVNHWALSVHYPGTVLSRCRWETFVLHQYRVIPFCDLTVGLPEGYVQACTSVALLPVTDIFGRYPHVFADAGRATLGKQIIPSVVKRMYTLGCWLALKLTVWHYPLEPNGAIPH